MPSALPGLSAAKASDLLQQTDRLIKTVPEVESVFGKAGRAETATDPAPLEMFETISYWYGALRLFTCSCQLADGRNLLGTKCTPLVFP
jgi:hypothetical protein